MCRECCLQKYFGWSDNSAWRQSTARRASTRTSWTASCNTSWPATGRTRRSRCSTSKTTRIDGTWSGILEPQPCWTERRSNRKDFRRRRSSSTSAGSTTRDFGTCNGENRVRTNILRNKAWEQKVGSWGIKSWHDSPWKSVNSINLVANWDDFVKAFDLYGKCLKVEHVHWSWCTENYFLTVNISAIGPVMRKRIKKHSKLGFVSRLTGCNHHAESRDHNKSKYSADHPIAPSENTPRLSKYVQTRPLRSSGRILSRRASYEIPERWTQSIKAKIDSRLACPEDFWGPSPALRASCRCPAGGFWPAPWHICPRSASPPPSRAGILYET